MYTPHEIGMLLMYIVYDNDIWYVLFRCERPSAYITEEEVLFDRLSGQFLELLEYYPM